MSNEEKPAGETEVEQDPVEPEPQRGQTSDAAQNRARGDQQSRLTGWRLRPASEQP